MNTISYPSELSNPGLMDQLMALSTTAKRQVIHLLLDSMLDEKRTTASRTDASNRTQAMLDKFAGAWVGEESADELMQKIREDSSIREPLNL